MERCVPVKVLVNDETVVRRMEPAEHDCSAEEMLSLRADALRLQAAPQSVKAHTIRSCQLCGIVVHT